MKWFRFLTVTLLLVVMGCYGQDTAPAAPELDEAAQMRIFECIRGCVVTRQYNPVCGSNSVTYENESRLMCASNCGVPVTLRRRGRC